jgi:hypothetical protein
MNLQVRGYFRHYEVEQARIYIDNRAASRPRRYWRVVTTCHDGWTATA